jgi:hypothetical protein
MSFLDPELFNRRNPFDLYDLNFADPTKTQHANFAWAFSYVIDSCQDQLTNRTLNELQYAIEFLNWLMRQADHQHRLAAIDKITGGKKTVFETDPRKILTLFEELDLQDQEGFPDASPEDYFAVLALAKCFEAIENHERITSYERGDTTSIVKGYPDELQDSLYYNSASARDSLLSEAKDLVAFIDGIRFAQLRARKDGKRGGKARTNRYDELNKTLMTVYEERYRHLTNRNAADRLYKEFQEAVEQVLSTDDPVHRIGIWIGRYKKTNGQ